VKEIPKALLCRDATSYNMVERVAVKEIPKALLCRDATSYNMVERVNGRPRI